MTKTASQKARNRLFYYSRLLHLYVSSSLFALLLFFCITGYFLNHLDIFGGQHSDDSVELALPLDSQKISALYQSTDNPVLGQVSELLAREFNLRKIESIEFDQDAGEIVFNYSLPAGYATAVLLVEDETLLVDYRQGDWLAVVNDLHKGRHSGVAWSWLIDVSAWLMVFFAITGVIILFQNRRQRKAALWVTVAGVLSPLAVYLLWVPRITGI